MSETESIDVAGRSARPLFAEVRVRAARDASGALLLTNEAAPAPAPESILERLAHWAAAGPDRIFLGERTGQGWRELTYAHAWAEVQATAARLLALELGPERPLAILAPNSIAHATAALAAMLVGIPVAPLALPAADKPSVTDLIERLAILTAGAIALDSASPTLVDQLWPGRAPLFGLTGAGPGVPALANLPQASTEEVAAAGRLVTRDTVAKLLFTSGSTGGGKPVINTHGMLASNQAALAQVWPFLEARPPRLTDWLPWRHTFGGNFCFNLALFHGGSLYIDDGSPLSPGRTLENLKSRPPSVYFSVPAGYEALLPRLESDEAFARSFFGGLDLLFNAGAALPETTHARLVAASRKAAGRDLPVIGSWGLTETSPAATMVWWTGAGALEVGGPLPGVTIKLVPERDRLELRVMGPNVTPGYWRMPEATADAFDADGFLRTGDAGRPADPDLPERGLVYDGRIVENFKLLSGSWVNAEAMRLAAIEAGWPLVANAVVTGLNRDQVGVLLFLDLDACRAALGADADGLDDEAVREHPAILARIRLGLATHNVGQAGSSRRIARFLVLAAPPDAAMGEVTAKGSLNQAVLLERRAADVERLYAAGFEVG